MNFGEALEAMKEGKKVTRTQFRDTCTVYIDFEPELVNPELYKTNNVKELPHLVMQKKEGNEIHSVQFAPSCENILAEDWEIVD